MGHCLKHVDMGDGILMEEKACENYVCASCGKKMISVNFVNGLCIQVFATHRPGCDLFDGTPAERTMEVTCESCRYFQRKECVYRGRKDERIQEIRM